MKISNFLIFVTDIKMKTRCQTKMLLWQKKGRKNSRLLLSCRVHIKSEFIGLIKIVDLTESRNVIQGKYELAPYARTFHRVGFHKIVISIDSLEKFKRHILWKPFAVVTFIQTLFLVGLSMSTYVSFAIIAYFSIRIHISQNQNNENIIRSRNRMNGH